MNGAYMNAATAQFDGFDIGSPGQLFGMDQGPCPSSGPMRDGNGDGIVDLADHAHFVLCQAGPLETAPLNCDCFDSDADSDIDLRDFEVLQRAMNLPPPPPPGGLLISEVIDATLTGGQPKVVEITNCGESAVSLGDYRIAIYFNGQMDEGFVSMQYGDMTGTLNPGQSYVVAHTGAGPGGAYLTVYGQEADLYDDMPNHNGNDVFQLYKNNGSGGDQLVDAYGVRGVDGTGQAWECLDSYAYSLPERTPNGGTFNPADWFFAGPGALTGFTPAQIAAATSAGTHICD
jgi:hypothetical protein